MTTAMVLGRLALILVIVGASVCIFIVSEYQTYATRPRELAARTAGALQLIPAGLLAAAIWTAS